jgi:hypothetical protein
MGDNDCYSDMVTSFTDLIINQYERTLKEQLKKIVSLPEKTGQMRITDWIEEEDSPG